jgi:hypothetical protein
MTAIEYILITIGVLALACVNAMAFVFDAEWINVAISLDSAYVGALITNYLKGVIQKNKVN